MFGAYIAVSDTSATSAESFFAIRRNVRRDRFAADFFLTFDQEFDVDWKAAMDVSKRFESFDVGIHLPLVVRRATGVKVARFHPRFERWRLPQLQGIYGLHVVVPVEKYGRLAGRFKPFGVDQRVPFGRDDFDRFQPHPPEARSDKLRRPPHVVAVVRQGADARDPQTTRKARRESVGRCFRHEVAAC